MSFDQQRPIQTSRLTSFCPIKPDPGLSSTCNWAIIGQASIEFKSTLWLLLMFYYPNDFFTVLENELKCRMVFFRALRMEQKTCGFLLLIGDLFFSFDLFPPLNYRVGSDTSDRHPRFEQHKRPKPVRKHSLLRVFLFLGL